MPITVEREAAAKDAAALSEGIVAFNKAHVPDLEEVADEVRFFVLAKDGAGTLQGGIRAVCYWNTLHIELVWLDEACARVRDRRKADERGGGFCARAQLRKGFC